MKKKIMTIMPIIIMPIFIPIYIILDKLILVDVFGCGCVPSTQTNILTIILAIWSMVIAKSIKRKIVKVLYCFTVILLDVILTLWIVNAFMWA